MWHHIMWAWGVYVHVCLWVHAWFADGHKLIDILTTSNNAALFYFYKTDFTGIGSILLGLHKDTHTHTHTHIYTPTNPHPHTHTHTHLHIPTLYTYWLAGIEFNPPSNPSWRQATWVFFCDQNVVDKNVVDENVVDEMVPHKPLRHTSKRPALSSIRELVPTELRHLSLTSPSTKQEDKLDVVQMPT